MAEKPTDKKSKNGKQTPVPSPQIPFYRVFEELVQKGKAKPYEKMPLLLYAKWTESTPVTKDQVLKKLKEMRKIPV